MKFLVYFLGIFTCNFKSLISLADLTSLHARNVRNLHHIGMILYSILFLHNSKINNHNTFERNLWSSNERLDVINISNSFERHDA